METPLHSTTFDNHLQTALSHLVNYPQLLPFIGALWEQHEHRIMFIAESHYLASTSEGKSNSTTWYERDSKNLTNWDFQHMHTRNVVNAADDYGVSKKGYVKAYSIFYNIKKAVFEACQIKNTNQTLFQNFGYYNYFQRPAEKTGLSIRNSEKDNRVAYQTIKAIAEYAKPTALIFVSKKAHHSFLGEHNKYKDENFIGIAIHHVPHPASAWWNRNSKAYGDISGKAKFIKIIKDMNLQLN